MHERQAIREAIVTALVGTAPNYRTDAGARVFKSRMAPIRTAELPAINVYTDSEPISPGSELSSPRELKRVVVIAIEAWVSATENVDDRLDDLALQIEAAMDLDPYFGDKAFDSILSSSEIGLKVDGDKPMGCLHLEYAVTYHTQVRTPAPAAIFDTAAASISIDGNQAPDDRPATLTTDIHGP